MGEEDEGAGVEEGRERKEKRVRGIVWISV